MDAIAKLVGGSFKQDPNSLKEKLSKPAQELLAQAFGADARLIVAGLTLLVEGIEEIYDMHTHLGGVGHGNSGALMLVLGALIAHQAAAFTPK